MRARRSWIAVGVLLIAILACNVPANQNPLQPPDLAGTITAQAMVIVRSSDTPAFTAAPASTSSPMPTPSVTLQPPASPPVTNVTLPSAPLPSTGSETGAASVASPAVPAAPTGLRANFQCKMSLEGFPHNDVHVDLSWQNNADNEIGYYVYRDDRLLVTLGRDETVFSDNTSMVATIVPNSGIPHITYAVQAFNAAGTSRKVTKSISCFG
jgi:hypothetical protein